MNAEDYDIFIEHFHGGMKGKAMEPLESNFSDHAVDVGLSFSFLPRVFELEAKANTEDALDVIYNEIALLFRGGRYDDVDLGLRHLPVEQLSIEAMIAVLAATLTFDFRLRFRSRAFERIEQTLRQRGVDPNGMLEGLRHMPNHVRTGRVRS